VSFDQHIGAIYLRFHQKYEGFFCKSCTTKYFLKATLITLGVGWLGIISIFLAPCYIIGNIIHYIGVMNDFKRGNRPRKDASASKLLQMNEVIQNRLAEGKPIAVIAREIAPKAGVSQVQASQHIISVMRALHPPTAK